jgi:hypothetical protein
MAGGDARYVEKPVPLTVEEADKVVNAPVEAVVAPTEALFTVPPLIAGDVRVFAVSVCVPSRVTRSADKAVRDTTADPLREIAVFELLELVTVLESVVPDDV